MRRSLCLLLLFLLAGCPSLPIQSFDAAGANQALDQWACTDLPPTQHAPCLAAYQGDSLDKRQNRLLRANLVLVMFARYAAARFDDYSDDITGDSSRLLGRLESAKQLLTTLQADARNNDPHSKFYEVERVDALIALLEVADAATRPTRRGLLGLAVLSSPLERLQRGTEVLKNGLKDGLYLDAYQKSLEALRASVRTRQDFRLAVAELDRQLANSCATLASYAKLTGQHCVLPPAQSVASSRQFRYTPMEGAPW